MSSPYNTIDDQAEEIRLLRRRLELEVGVNTQHTLHIEQLQQRLENLMALIPEGNDRWCPSCNSVVPPNCYTHAHAHRIPQERFCRISEDGPVGIQTYTTTHHKTVTMLERGWILHNQDAAKEYQQFLVGTFKEKRDGY